MVLQVRHYKENDKDMVLDLFKTVFKKEMHPDFWKWRFCSSFGQSIRYLMWDDEQLVGHYVVHPITFALLGEIEKVLFSMSVMTHPEYRGRGIFPNLADVVYAEARELGYRFAVGFPNTQSYVIHFKKLGWVSFGQILEFEKHIQSSDIVLAEKKGTCEIIEILNFDDRIDEIWRSNKSNSRFLFPRDRTYLNWRYIEHPVHCFTDFPDYIYHKYIVNKDGRPAAYFVLKQFNDKVHIVDFFGDLGEQVMRSIISYTIGFCHRNSLSQLSFWSSHNREDQGMFELYGSLGFTKKLSDAYFGIKPLSSKLPSIITDKTQWFVRMGDSDVF